MYSSAVDHYIEKSEDFARPILERLREIVHETFPPIEESLKWSFPHFNYKGIVCSMAAFSKHCAFGFWKESLMHDNHGVFADQAMGSLGRITSLNDLPPADVLRAYILQAIDLNERGIHVKKVRVSENTMPEIPQELHRILKQNPGTADVFSAFPPSQRKEYIEWIAEAKTEATRIKRATQAGEWIAEGKHRHWKYQK